VAYAVIGRQQWRRLAIKPDHNRIRTATLSAENASDKPVGAENRVTLRDLGIFVDQAAEPIPP
jgi:hypothetical protein